MNFGHKQAGTSGASTAAQSAGRSPVSVQARSENNPTKNEQVIDITKWFELYGAFVARSIARLSGLESGVDDLVQEVFLMAWRKRARMDVQTSAKGWLYLTARNLVLHNKRSLARRLRAEQGLVAEPADDVKDAQQQLEQQELALQVRRVVARLPMKQREVFSLFELEGLSGEEISQILHLPLNTVWTRLHHARKRFRSLWQKQQQRSAA